MRTKLIAGALAALVVGAFSLTLAQQQRPFIWGGVPAKDGDFPFQVALMAPEAEFATCGGVLIRNNWVLTAAHCMKTGPLVVKGGSRKLTDKRHPARKIAEVREHPNFVVDPSSQGRDKRYFNDLSLLRLEQEFEIDNHNIATIRLPDDAGHEAYLINGQPNFVAGWGQMDGSQHVLELHFAQVQPVGRDQCRVAHPGLEVRDSNLCSGDKRKNHCLGDSGGPYVANIRGQARLLGIISWGDACSLDRPGVHSRALSFKAWIDDCINGRCKDEVNTKDAKTRK